MGGLLTMEIARLVADDPTALFTIVGTLLIDSPYHIPNIELGGSPIDPDLTHLPALIQKSFEHCNTYLDEWRLPQWTGSTRGGKELRIQAGGKGWDVPPGQAVHLSLGGEWTVTTDEKPYEHAEVAEKPVAPPPGVLLRALNRSVKADESETRANGGCTIDLFRDEKLLGWGGRYPDFVKATLDIDSAHFDMFDKTNENRVSETCSRGDGGRLACM